MARKGLKVEIEIPKESGTEIVTAEALPLTVDQTLELMETKAKYADGTQVMIPDKGPGKPEGAMREATEMDVAPWMVMAIIQSSASAAVALKLVRFSLRKYPQIAERTDLGQIMDIETTAEIAAHALRTTELAKRAEAQTRGEGKSP